MTSSTDLCSFGKEGLVRMVTDPVCGMQFDPATAFGTREHAGKTLHFCSQACVDRYDKDSHYYGPPDEDAHHGVNPAHEWHREKRRGWR